MALMCMAQDPSALRVKAETKQREADRLKVSAPSGRFAALCSLYRGARSLSLSLSLYLSLSLSLLCLDHSRSCSRSLICSQYQTDQCDYLANMRDLFD
jgi:hypothetical protein